MMKRYAVTVAKLILFWLCFFTVGRLIFLLAYHHLLTGLPVREVLACFPHAFRLDVATFCYLMAVPVVLLLLETLGGSRFWHRMLKIWLLIEIVVCCFILLGEIAVYGEWLSKLNYKILLYLKHPMEILQTATVRQLLFSFAAIVLLSGGSYYLLCKWVLSNPLPQVNRAFWKMPMALLVSGGLCFLGMRGGFDAIPISQSAAYYSSHAVLNDAAVNPYYNLFCSFYDFGSVDDRLFHFMEDEEADALVEALHRTPKDTLVPILKKNDVNVVFIILESWTADLVESISGVPDLTPCFHALERGGLLFTRYYSNGHRSQQAMSSIFSSYPALPVYDITDDFSKYSHLPSLPLVLKNAGYYTSYYFGGNLDYGNIRSYLFHCQFDKIIEEKQMNGNLPRAKLGIHDQYTFPLFHRALNGQPQPFMSVLFTVSSHSPYDQPRIIPDVEIEDEERPFLNSAKYADYCLGKFFDSVRNEPWYANTLFVIVGDHGHPTHLKKSAVEPAYLQVPLLFYGEVIPENLRGMQIPRVGSHVDLAATLLHQLGLDASDFVWSKDLLNPYAPAFAYFETYTGYGWVRPQGAFTELKSGDVWHTEVYGDTAFASTWRREGQAYLQHLYQGYCCFEEVRRK